MERAAPPEVLTSTPHGRTLLFSFAAGQGVPTHKHPAAQVTVAVLGGQIEVTTTEQGHTQKRSLKAGEVLTHNGEHEISLLAKAESRVLVCLIHE